MSRYIPAFFLTVFAVLYGRSLPLAASGEIDSLTVLLFLGAMILFFWLTVRHPKL